MTAPIMRRIENTDGIVIVIQQRNPQTGEVIERLQPFLRADLEKQLENAELAVAKWQEALAFLGEPVVEITE